MKKKIISGVVTTALLCQIAPLSIFADEIKSLGETQSIEQMKNTVSEKVEKKQNEKTIIENKSNFINIADENLKKALNYNIRRENPSEINRPLDSNITQNELESLKALVLAPGEYENLKAGESIGTIKNIDGIQHCINVKEIYLQDNKLTNIDALSGLILNDLKVLYLNRNELENVNGLNTLNAPNLTILGLADNNIKDISVIKPEIMQNINVLGLTNNQISDIEHLKYLASPNLKQLFLDGNQIEDISVLGKLNLQNLEEIDLSSNHINNIEVLKSVTLPKLKGINLSKNSIIDISVLSKLNLKNLEGIWLDENKINTIENLKSISSPKLRTISLSKNSIQDISPLKKFESKTLTKLLINDQEIVDPDQNSKGIYFSIPNPVKDMDGNTIIPTLENQGEFINDNPEKYPNGLLKWNTVGKLANYEGDKVVNLDYDFIKEFTISSGTNVVFSGKRKQPVKYYRGILPTINADTLTIRKGSVFNPMNGISAKDQDDIGDPIKDITKDVKVISGGVNVYVPGTYTLTYEVTDSWGNTVTKDRKVIVADTLMIEEIVGSDRYNTANKISDKWTRADNVVIANSDSIVDAMTASPFAYAKNAPVLLSSKSSLTPETKASIARLQTKTVYLIGGENSLDKNLEKEIKDMGVDVVRIAGNDRFETSLKIAKEVDNISDVSQVAIVNGQKGLPDAISISSPAAINNMPIILSNNAGDIPQGKDFMKSEDLSKAYVIGGNGTVSETLKNEVSDLIKNKPVTRLGGNDRIETNLSVLNEFYKSGALDNLFVVKDGAKREIDLVDSLSVSSLAAKEKSPVMIVGENLTTEQSEFIKKKEFNKLTRVGGNGNENAFNKIVKLVKNK